MSRPVRPSRHGRPAGVRVSVGFLISGWLFLAPGMAPAWASPVTPSADGSTSAGGDDGSSDTIDGIMAQIAAARGQLADLDAKLSEATEAFDAGRIRLGQARAAVDDAEGRVDRADAAVQDAVQERRGLAASAYRAGGLDTLSAILTGDPGGALDRAGALNALSRRAGLAETRERLARVDLTEARATARTTMADAQSALDAVTDQKKIIETSAGSQRTLLDGLIVKQADLERQARAREAAARQARQQAAAAEAARVAQAAAAEQTRLRQQSSLVQQATDTFAATPVTPAAPVTPASPAPPVPAAAAGAPPPPPPPAVAGSGGAATAVAEAYRQIGKPYVWGAEGPNEFDCSGLTQWVWAKAGVHLPHYTGDQWNAGRHVSRDQLIPGDLVFFNGSLDHVGIYIGNDQMIHAPHTGAVVRVESVWWSSFQGAVRPFG
ncbi:C40 family peptidase [Pseudofrankia asymbiotica]|uniref:Glycoside hydrolase n=1 Tax=Pseudofrankia asymbiotica TaxID=1834516 RepID=A0A1V2IAT9_9ACTN|nr:C40 family peptidase [Pseudofrankia asymbiotica]ONH30205.1 glycoside hydrolase [Pseudofrankia asymbiotica]